MAAPEAPNSGTILRDLFLLMRTVLTHGMAHPLSERTANTLRQTLASARPPLELQFVGQAVFRDRALIPLELDEYLKSQEVARGLAGMSAHEISIDQVPPASALVLLGNALAQGSRGSFDSSKLDLPGIRWREIPGAFWGREAEDVDPEVFCATHLALAVAKAEGLVAEPKRGWNWSDGMSIVRRLENGIQVGGGAMARALEIAPGDWSRARRAVSAAYRFLSVVSALGAGSQTGRAGAHAALAVAGLGLAETGGIPIGEAARLALERMIEGPGSRSGKVAPHRVRVCALLYELGEERASSREWRGVLGLLHLVYELERRRRPAGVGFALTFADLVAQAVSEMGTVFDEEPVRALIHACGEIPPGARVRLEDGAVGIVLGRSEGGDPLRPTVLVGTTVVVPRAPVSLVPPPQPTRPR